MNFTGTTDDAKFSESEEAALTFQPGVILSENTDDNLFHMKCEVIFQNLE